MKLILRYSLLAIACVLFSYSYSQEYNQIDAQGKKQGKWFKIYEGTKKIKYQGEFKDDIPVGKFVFYYENGNIKARNSYFNNGKDSYASTYHENGKLMSTGKYVNQKKDSVWSFLDQYGNYISRDSYKNGEKHGKCVLFYAFNPELDEGQPNLLEVVVYFNGEKEGEYTKYYRNGKKMVQGNYALNEKEGKFTTYYSSGKKKTVIHYKHGIKNGYKLNYDGNEEETSKQFYRNGYLLEGKQLESYLERKRKRAMENN